MFLRRLLTSRRKSRRRLTVEVRERKHVITEYACVADSDLKPCMIVGSLGQIDAADVVVLKNEKEGRLTVLQSRVPLDELIERIQG